MSFPIVAIIGRPNVGKSSLFNRLVGERQAIVDDKAGTTRDPVQHLVTEGQHRYWLFDTAGEELGASRQPLEHDVKAQTAIAKESADLIVIVVDGSGPLSNDDHHLAKEALKSRKPVILAVNKLDTDIGTMPEEIKRLGIRSIVGTSAMHNQGIDDLSSLITKAIPKVKQVSAPEADLRLALLGRPNVGKSSLFNRLIGKKQAIVHQMAGTTRDLNRAIITHEKTTIEVVDTAGVRRHSLNVGIELFSFMRTAAAINEADVCGVVIDASEPATKFDQHVAGLVKNAGKGLFLIINKYDLLKGDEPAQKALMMQLKSAFAFCYWAPVLLVSAESGRNLVDISETAIEIHKRAAEKVQTSKLNDLFAEATLAHPPSGMGHPKIKYATQTGTRPPQFTIFGKNVRDIHASYLRYLEGKLRDQFDFSGTPIILKADERTDP